MLNKAILVGRIVREPEIRSASSGVSVATFTVAIQRKYKESTGERASDFINCVAFRRTAEFVSQWFAKGDMISIDGSIQTRTYDDKEGKRNYITEVIANDVGFISGSKKENGEGIKDNSDSDDDLTGLDFGVDIQDEDLPF